MSKMWLLFFLPIVNLVFCAENEERNEAIEHAKWLMNEQEFDDVITMMKNVVLSGNQLVEDERELLNSAYKSIVDASRIALIYSNDALKNFKGPGTLDSTRRYKNTVQDELIKMCSDILDLLKKHLIPKAVTVESQVYYYKMQGDYNRYIAEYSTDKMKENSIKNALDAYKLGSDIAKANLSPVNPHRLGLALNLSVLYLDILHSSKMAQQVAKSALDEAYKNESEFDKLSEQDRVNSALTIESLTALEAQANHLEMKQ